MKEAVFILLAILLIAGPIGGAVSGLKVLDTAKDNIPNVVPQIVNLSGGSPLGPAPEQISVSVQGIASAVQRLQLALNAGWSPADAIVATAISLSEDPSGDPAALSPRNKNGTYDFCLWQINSGWWAQFGGQQALADPQTCANAAHVIWSHGGWGQWCTYPGGCGGGPGAPSYPANLAKARAAAGSLT